MSKRSKANKVSRHVAAARVHEAASLLESMLDYAVLVLDNDAEFVALLEEFDRVIQNAPRRADATG